ncbi:hypothetical protein [Oenococcus oeni]|uniref:hypothetical protein n=1 Tax=Oenococcus oeni TaxID=1247 RepID=UPI0015D66C12|nr:hypothetical protein [Oenococcus oeni]
MHEHTGSKKVHGLKKAEQPKYKAGTKVKLTADHMKGFTVKLVQLGRGSGRQRPRG